MLSVSVSARGGLMVMFTRNAVLGIICPCEIDAGRVIIKLHQGTNIRTRTRAGESALHFEFFPGMVYNQVSLGAIPEREAIPSSWSPQQLATDLIKTVLMA